MDASRSASRLRVAHQRAIVRPSQWCGACKPANARLPQLRELPTKSAVSRPAARRHRASTSSMLRANYRPVMEKYHLWCLAFACCCITISNTLPTESKTFNQRESSYLKDFESKIVNAAKAGKRTELVYLQKLFESEILLAILKSLNDSATDLDNISENLILPVDNLETAPKSREKRSLSLIASLLGSSSAAKAAASSPGGTGASSGGDASGGGSDSGSILGLITPLLGSSSGGGGNGGSSESGEGGGGSDSGSILSLITPLLGSSSGGGGGSGEGDSQDGGGSSGSILSLLPSLLGSSSGGGGGSGEAGNGGGGGSDLSSILSISSSSSNSGGGDSASATSSKAARKR